MIKKKQFDTLLIKNTLAFAVPAIVVLLVLLFMFLHYPVLEQAENVKIENTEAIQQTLQNLYAKNTTNVEYTAKDLYYSGFDYLVNGKIKGAYYYKFEGNMMQVYLLKTAKPKEYIETVTMQGKVIRDTVVPQYILTKLVSENNLDMEFVDGYVSEFLISEPDYPYSFIWMIYVIFYMPIIVSVLILLYTIFVWFNPMLHSQVHQLECYGEPEEILVELNLEMKNHMLMRKSNVYVTENYLIVSYLTRTEVVRLDAIKYMAKEEVQGGYFKHPESVFRLTMSSPEQFFYEVDFGSEELVDDVIDYVKIVNPLVKM